MYMHTFLKTNLYLIFAIVSLLFSYLLITFNGFPYLGLSLTFAILSSLIYFLKEDKSKLDTLFYSLSLIFSFCIIWRANEFLTFLNILAVFYSGSLLTFNSKEKSSLGFLNGVLSPARLTLSSLLTRNIFHIKASDTLSISTNKKGDTTKAVLITLVLLTVIIPLLASANPIFERLVTDIASIFNLSNLFEKINGPLLAIRTIFFLGFLFILPRFFSFLKSKKDSWHAPSFALDFPLSIPKAAVSIVLILFFITQAQLYFSDIETLRALGYTYSQYAREVFAQLTIVAGIIIGLLYNDKSRSKLDRFLTYLLIIEGIFLTFMAFKSVNDYSAQWGFTEKRLWGYTGVFWSFSVLAAYGYSYLHKRPSTRFVQSVLAITAITLLIVNVANFDSLIYNYRKSVTERGVDHGYLAYLSSDAHSYKEELTETTNLMNKTFSTSEEYYQTGIPVWTTLSNIERLQEKYKKLDIRTFNLSEYAEYLDIKGIDTQAYRNIWANTYPDNPTPPSLD